MPNVLLLETEMDWTEWLGVAFGILLFRYTVSCRDRAQKVKAVNNLKAQADRVWTPPRDTERNGTHTRHTEYGGTRNDNYHGVRSRGG